MRRAARLAHLSTKFASSIHLRLGNRVADARNILALLILCATLNSPVAIETNGEDELAALEAVKTFFSERSV